jgi:hypothetical protein
MERPSNGGGWTPLDRAALADQARIRSISCDRLRATLRNVSGDGGHGILPIGGHRNSTRAAAISPQWRPRISPPVLS